MLRKTILMAALLAATPALAQQQSESRRPPSPPPTQNLCEGRVVVETVRPVRTIPGGFTYEVLLQNANSAQRQGYSVTVSFENFPALAREIGGTINIPNASIAMTVPGGFGSRSSETQFGTVSVNTQRIYLGAGVGVRYDSGAITRGSPAVVRLTNCRPVGG